MSPNNKNEIRVLVVNDSSVILELISHILNEAPGIKVIGTASNGEEAVEAVENKKPDVVIIPDFGKFF